MSGALRTSALQRQARRAGLTCSTIVPNATTARVVTFEGARLSGAICYDWSFPEVARDHATDGAGLALVPASDWRGIDSQHGRMAVMNAVAAGPPMVRPVRAARSIATDAYGRLLGTMPAGDPDGVMVVAVPTVRVPTLYARSGEIVPMPALGFLVAVALTHALRAGRQRRAVCTQASAAPCLTSARSPRT